MTSNRRPRLEVEAAPSLDRLTRLAADLFQVPQAAIYRLVDDRLELASLARLDDPESLEISAFCNRVADSNAPLILDDISDHEAFRSAVPAGSAATAGFYAGLPLDTPAGSPLGVLCIANAQPRQGFSTTELATFKSLAGLAIDLLQHRNAGESRQSSAALLAAIGHDLRTPMNGILGMAELLLAGDGLSERDCRRIEVIKRSGTTVLSMVEAILDLAKIDASEPDTDASPIDLRNLVQTVISQLERQNAGNARQFDLSGCFERHHHILGHAAQIHKLFSNFLDIATRLAADGAIRIVASTEPTPMDRVWISMKAEFSGRPDDAVEPLLASSVQTLTVASGKVDETSLGIVLCKKLAAMMGGDVGLERYDGERSALWLKVLATPHLECRAESPAPQLRTPPDSVASTPASAPNAPPTASIIRDVLVAEDDLDMALFIEELLEEAGYRSTVVHDGASVLRLLDQKDFDVVLMDGRMPDMSGLETAERIRRLPHQRASLPIIALTGEALSGDRERYMSAGMDAYIAKPVNYEMLIATIDRCCSQRQHSASANFGAVADP